MRLFFALFPDAVTRERLSSIVDCLDLAAAARRVEIRNLHVTLAFVGEVPDRDLAAFRAMGAALRLRRCVIELDSLQYWSKSEALVLAASRNPRGLATQTHRLRAAVAAEVRHDRGAMMRWRAHATLARKVVQAPVLVAMPPVAWVSETFSLVHSNTSGGASSYTVVESWPLLYDA